MAEIDQPPDAASQTPLGWMFDGDGIRFGAEYYLQRPFAKAGSCLAVCDLANIPVVDQLLAQPGVDVIVGHQGQVLADPIHSLSDAQNAVTAGYTVGLRHVQKIHHGLGDLAKQFEVALGGKVDIHLYWTPAGRPGFGWHYDAEEVFVLQTVGSKTWKLRKNTVNPWPLMENVPANQRYEREISPTMACRLETGDWLYIPSGHWHTTEAHDESISLSIGIRPSTAIDLFDAVRSRLMSSMLWRQRLPMNGSFAQKSFKERATELSELCRLLANDLTDQLNGGFLIEQFCGRK